MSVASVSGKKEKKKGTQTIQINQEKIFIRKRFIRLCIFFIHFWEHKNQAFFIT